MFYWSTDYSFPHDICDIICNICHTTYVISYIIYLTLYVLLVYWLLRFLITSSCSLRLWHHQTLCVCTHPHIFPKSFLVYLSHTTTWDSLLLSLSLSVQNPYKIREIYTSHDSLSLCVHKICATHPFGCPACKHWPVGFSHLQTGTIFKVLPEELWKRKPQNFTSTGFARTDHVTHSITDGVLYHVCTPPNPPPIKTHTTKKPWLRCPSSV